MRFVCRGAERGCAEFCWSATPVLFRILSTNSGDETNKTLPGDYAATIVFATGSTRAARSAGRVQGDDNCTTTEIAAPQQTPQG